jgi:DNA-binding transcriptional ArsR family regulator
MESSLKLEEFGSKGLLKILETLIQHGPLNLARLARKVGMNSGNVDMHLKKLVEHGLVTQRRYGKIRMIRPGFTELYIRLQRGKRTRITVDE